MAIVEHKGVLDRFLTGCLTEELLPAPHMVIILNPLERPVVDVER
jgi:hypothetical protein